MIRAKFKVDKITNDVNGSVLEASPVTCGSSENETFFKLTPFGNLRMGTLNEDAIGQLKQGQEFYMDITPITTD